MAVLAILTSNIYIKYIVTSKDAGKLTVTPHFDGDFGAEILTSWCILKQSSIPNY